MQQESQKNAKSSDDATTERAEGDTAATKPEQSNTTSTVQPQQASNMQPPTPSESKVISTHSYDWQANYLAIVNKTPAQTKPYIPNYFRSGFMYVVLENELSLKNKRRIVNLSSDDLLYASVTGKCVFIQIDWHNDFTNTIKVHESNHTWETTFSELIDTRPVALRHLFSRSEVWAEGHYKPLSG